MSRAASALGRPRSAVSNHLHAEVGCLDGVVIDQVDGDPQGGQPASERQADISHPYEDDLARLPCLLQSLRADVRMGQEPGVGARGHGTRYGGLLRDVLVNEDERLMPLGASRYHRPARYQPQLFPVDERDRLGLLLGEFAARPTCLSDQHPTTHRAGRQAVAETRDGTGALAVDAGSLEDETVVGNRQRDVPRPRPDGNRSPTVTWLRGSSTSAISQRSCGSRHRCWKPSARLLEAAGTQIDS